MRDMNPQQLLVSNETSLGGTVLVVDDDEATCQLLGDWVRLLGFHVMTARGAVEALALMRDRPAQVAFCDIVMPGHDGVWLIDQLRALFRTLRDGQPFAAANAVRVRRIAWVVILGEIARTSVNLWENFYAAR